MPSFPTERARLKVRNPSGDVQVETADVAETTVELVPLNDSDATRQAIEKANVGARGEEVFVELEGRSWSISIGNWGVGSAKVSVRITCPEGSDLECDTASADVRASGFSQITCFLWRRNNSDCWQCREFGLAIYTASLTRQNFSYVASSSNS